MLAGWAVTVFALNPSQLRRFGGVAKPARNTGSHRMTHPTSTVGGSTVEDELGFTERFAVLRLNITGMRLSVTIRARFRADVMRGWTKDSKQGRLLVKADDGAIGGGEAPNGLPGCIRHVLLLLQLIVTRGSEPAYRQAIAGDFDARQTWKAWNSSWNRCG